MFNDEKYFSYESDSDLPEPNVDSLPRGTSIQVCFYSKKRLTHNVVFLFVPCDIITTSGYTDENASVWIQPKVRHKRTKKYPLTFYFS